MYWLNATGFHYDFDDNKATRAEDFAEKNPYGVNLRRLQSKHRFKQITHNLNSFFV